MMKNYTETFRVKLPTAIMMKILVKMEVKSLKKAMRNYQFHEFAGHDKQKSMLLLGKLHVLSNVGDSTSHAHKT